MSDKQKIKAYLASDNCVYGYATNGMFYKIDSKKKLTKVTDEKMIAKLSKQLLPPKNINENGDRYFFRK